MYFLVGISLIFALLLVINAAGTAWAAILLRLVASRLKKIQSARKRADLIFALRVFPFAAALVFVAAFLLPSYLLFEPPSPGEAVGLKLAVISAASAAGVLTAFYRLLQTRRATRGLVSDWLEHAERIEIDGVSTPVYRIRHRFPVVAVVGTFRPEMFIASQIFDALSVEEFRAVIAHENGHLAAHDNLKRSLLRVCRDLLIFPLGGSLDRSWAANSEIGADEYAARIGGKRAAINLAAALVKIARIIPNGTRPLMPAGAFLIEAQTAEVAARVRNLLQITEGVETPQNLSAGKIPARICAAITFAAVFLFASNHDFLREIHHLLEMLIASF